MHLDQIAFYAHDGLQEEEIKKKLGLAEAEWIRDEVWGRVEVDALKGQFSRSRGHSRAILQFNYSYGIELEILTYLEGPQWHRSCETVGFPSRDPFISHFGIHLDDGEDFPEMDLPLVQEMWTESHTNPYLIERQRTYHYRIYDARPTMGCYLKFIKRIEPKQSALLPQEKAVEMSDRTLNAGDLLAKAAETYRERHKVYGDNYKLVGAVMEGLFPDGLTIKTAHDWNRLHILLLLVIKQTRYVQNWATGGHQDSIHDAAVYSAMLEEIDALKN